MKILRILCLPVLLLASACSLLTPQQRSNMRFVLDDELAAGTITQTQHDALAEALDNDEPIDWGSLGFLGVSLLSGLLGGPLIVRRMRGAPTQKVGLPAAMVTP